jgi:hypothetical protein
MAMGAARAAGNIVGRRVSASGIIGDGRSIGAGRSNKGRTKAGIRQRMATSIAMEDRTMRIKFVAMIALVLAGGLLSGCIIEPGGGYGHHHYYHDHY